MQNKNNKFTFHQILQNREKEREINGILLPGKSDYLNNRGYLKLSTNWRDLSLRVDAQENRKYQSFLWQEVRVRGKYFKHKGEIVVTSISGVKADIETNAEISEAS